MNLFIVFIFLNLHHFVFLLEHSALENVGFALIHSISKKCAHCNHFGASLTCKTDGCNRMFHYPCATASGAFQELQSLNVFCSQHLSFVANSCDGSVCYICKILGDIANLMFCSACGEHYHGRCVGLAQLPGKNKNQIPGDSIWCLFLGNFFI